MNRNAANRPSLEGCELQLPQPSSTKTHQQQGDGQVGLARLKIRHPPMLFQSTGHGDSRHSDCCSDSKYAAAPHLKYLTEDEKMERERLANATGRGCARQPLLGYRDVSLALAWPMLACGSVHPDLYRRSVTAATSEDALMAAAEAAAFPEEVQAASAKSHRRRKDAVLMHEEKIFNQDRVLRSLERR